MNRLEFGYQLLFVELVVSVPVHKRFLIESEKDEEL